MHLKHSPVLTRFSSQLQKESAVLLEYIQQICTHLEYI